MRKLIIWHNDSKDFYYHRLVNGSYDFDYKVGNKNQYGHTIVHIVDNFDYYKKRVPIKKQIIGKTISFLSRYK